MKSCGAQTFRVFVYRRRPFCDLSLSDGHADRFKSTVLFTFTLFSSIICGPHRVGPKPLIQTLKGQSTFQHSECVRSDLVEEKWPKWPVSQQSTKTQKTLQKMLFYKMHWRAHDFIISSQWHVLPAKKTEQIYEKRAKNYTLCSNLCPACRSWLRLEPRLRGQN